MKAMTLLTHARRRSVDLARACVAAARASRCPLGVHKDSQRGVAIVETVIALPILLVVILGALQFGLIYEAKATLNHAALQAARSGAVDHANPQALRRGLARGLVPLYSPDSSIAGIASTIARINGELSTNARIRILNPTREAFEDFGEDVDGVREIPNARLHTLSTTTGTQSRINIQDANILRVEITYGYELKVPLVNWFITRILLATSGGSTMDAFEQQLLRRTLLPIASTSTVRMQSPARLSDLVVSRADLPDAQRFDPASAPPDERDEDHDEESENEGESGEGESGSSLADGFLGFGGGPADGSGGGSSPGGDSGSGSDSGSGNTGDGGENSGNPQMCSAGDDDGGSPWPPSNRGPGDASPVITPDPALGASHPIALPSLSVGNPIHVATGNKYQLEVDVTAAPGADGLGFVRHYNSDAASKHGVLGAGWRHSYEASLSYDTQADRIVIRQADGRAVHFTRPPSSVNASSDEMDVYFARRASDGHVVLGADGDATWRPEPGRELVFDTEGGHLTALRDAHVTVDLRYDAQGKLERVAGPYGSTLRFYYYANGRLAKIAAAAGVWRYRYDAKGNLLAVALPDGALRRYEYEDTRHPHHLTGITIQERAPPSYGQQSKLIRVASWRYDEQGRGVLSTHPDGAGKVTLSYGDGYTDVTDAFGRTSRYFTEVRNAISVVTEVRGPGCGACGQGNVRYSYNDRLQVTDAFKQDGSATHFTYDDQGRLSELSRSTDGRQREWVARYAYRQAARLPARVERPSINPAASHTLDFHYTASGEIESAIERGFQPQPDGTFRAIERKTTFRYDERGRVELIDGPRKDALDLTRFEYDAQHRLVATIDPDGIERRVLEHDEAGRPRRLRNGNAPPLSLTYDSGHRIIRVTEHRQAGERAIHYDYDVAGRLIEIRHPDGRIERIGYDGAGRPNRRTSDRSGLTLAHAFGADGQISTSALVNRTGDALRVVHFAYDAQRRLLEARDGDGPPLRQLVYEDDDRRPDRAIDPLGHETLFRYDALGQLTSLTASDGGTTAADYDRYGRPTRLTAPNGAQTRYEYDDFGRRVREFSADRGVTHYTYDAANNLTDKVDARGVTTTFGYTPGNRLAQITTTEGTTSLAYTNGRLVEINDSRSGETFSYDADGNLVQHRRRVGGRRFSTAYRYDTLGRVTQRKLPSGEWLAYEYETGTRPIRIARNRLFRDRTLLGVHHEAGQGLSPLTDIRFGNELVQRTRFDASGRVHRRSVGELSRSRYSYDEASRLVRLSRDNEVTRYGYDTMGRLTSERSADREYRYTYDTNGNRKTATRTSRSADAPEARTSKEQYEYAPQSNRLLSAGESGVTFEYDATGNPLQIDNRRYEYNSAGRPIKLYIDGRLTAEYEYNLWGERIRKTRHSLQGRQTTLFLYERNRLIAEADERGRITREYLYLDHHPVAILDRGIPYWIHTDHLGSPIAVTDAKRRVVWRADYEPFGFAKVEEDPDRDGRKLTLNLRFPGQYADAESGTHYNIMRDYDPTVGRYLTPDPLGTFDGTNPFAYVHGNPTNSFDSLGLYDEMVHYYMTYFLALVAGLPQDTARTMAIAAQYVDENWLTQPVRLGTVANAAALPLYHFVLDDRGPLYGDRTTDPQTRFYNPSSDQLTQLLASTDPSRLHDLWVQAHPSGIPGLCPLPDVAQINNARYQLYGEYLHAYQDTFAHRDLLNVPYGVDPSLDTHPMATYGGHTGLYDSNPFEFEQPDRTYNQDEDDESSRCEVRYVLGGTETRENISSDACAAIGRQSNVATATHIPRPSKCVYTYFRHAEDLLGTREEVRGITAAECSERAASVQAIQTQYLPEGDLWAYNELRTLRMEYEIFHMFGEEFSEEIERNRALVESRGGVVPTITWQDLAGAAWNSSDQEANARLGVERTYDQWLGDQGLSELNTVLQRFNASDADEGSRRDILNAWLENRLFRTSNGQPMVIESWEEVETSAPRRRWNNIGWIPAGSFEGLLLPRDEACLTLPWMSSCDDRPRR